MTDQDRFAFPEPLDEEPRRFTPLLAVAAAIGALAVLIVVYLLFFSSGGAPPSPPGTSVGGSPGATGPAGSPAPPPPGTGPTPIPESAATDLADGICTDPLPPFDGLLPSVVEGFREYCVESIVTVLVDEGIDPLQVSAAGWAFTGVAAADTGGLSVSRVFITVADERRSRRYLVSHADGDGDAVITGEPDRVRAIADDLLIFAWTREA